MSPLDRRAVWRDLVERRLPEAARAHRDWPVRLDHCFARILLDHACGGPWRDSVTPPAHANLPPDRLEAAIALGEAVLAGQADLHALNLRSLAWRGKLRASSARSAQQPDPRPHPEVRRSRLEGGFQGSPRLLEGSFEVSAPLRRLRMTARVGKPPIVRPDTPDEGQGGTADPSGHPA